MDAKLKEKWVTALRSGKYEQGTGIMKSGNNFCCLGVLCEIDPDTNWDEEHNGYVYNKCPKETLTTQLDDRDGNTEHTLLEKYNISIEMQDLLINMNDYQKFSFDEIADFIEKEL